MKRPVIGGLTVSVLTCGMLFYFACGGGGGDSKPQRLAFYTSTAGNGALATWGDVSGSGLTGLMAADAVCQARANAAALAGTYVAWLSDDTDDAYCRVHGLSGKKIDQCGQSVLPTTAGPWFRTDGKPFTGSIEGLTLRGVVFNPMQTDESGRAEADYNSYWTATNGAGVATANNCNNWMDSNVSGPFVDIGVTYGTVGWFTDVVYTAVCWQYGSLLCLETGSGNAVPNPADEGKVVFATSAVGNGNLGTWPLANGATGIAAGDNICQGLAQAALIPNSGDFKAWLSDSSTDAIDRLTSDGPWVRLDGVQVAASKSALINSWLETSISVTVNGQYTRSSVWTGTNGNGLGGGSTCSDWTDGDSASGAVGDSAQSDDTGWSGTAVSSCSSIARLYCFED